MSITITLSESLVGGVDTYTLGLPNIPPTYMLASYCAMIDTYVVTDLRIQLTRNTAVNVMIGRAYHNCGATILLTLTFSNPCITELTPDPSAAKPGHLAVVNDIGRLSWLHMPIPYNPKLDHHTFLYRPPSLPVLETQDYNVELIAANGTIFAIYMEKKSDNDFIINKCLRIVNGHLTYEQFVDPREWVGGIVSGHVNNGHLTIYNHGYPSFTTPFDFYGDVWFKSTVANGNLSNWAFEMAFQRSNDDQKLRRLEGALAWATKTNDALPSDHPYRRVPPTANRAI